MEKPCKKCALKAAPDPFLILVNNPKKSLHARNSFENKIFLSNLVPKLSNGQNYQKQKGPGTSDQTYFRLRNKFRKTPLSVKYYLSKFDDVK